MNINELKRLQNEQLNILKEVIKICQKYDIRYYMFYGSLLGTIRHNGTIPWDYDIDICMFRDDYKNFYKYIKELSEKLTVVHISTDNIDFTPLASIYKKNTRIYHPNHFINDDIHGIHIDIFILDYVKEFTYFKQKFVLWFNRYLSLALLDDFEKGWLYDKFSKNYIKKFIIKSTDIISKYFNYQKIQKMIFNSLVQKRGYKNNKVMTLIDLNNIFDYQDFKKIIKRTYEDITVNVPYEYDKLLKQIYGKYWIFPPEEERYTSNMDEIIIEFENDIYQ